jgi:diguanylate cyclase (GGDEF)-like protein
LLLGAALVTLANSSIPHINRVSVGALQFAGACAALLALAVLFLPWQRHFRITANCAIAAALALLVVSDHFDHYSRSRAAVAVYPVFFILLIAWTGITRSRGTATIVALVAAPALYWMLAEGAQASVGLQCLIVTMPVAAILGEVLSWNSHRARTMTSIEMRRRLHDPLTGLANRTMLSIQLDSALARARRHQGALAVLYIDLDHFKHINDTHGHGAGDDALIDVAARMSSVARETDTVARVGGDEFVVLCDGLETISDAVEIAQRLLDMADTEAGPGPHEPQSLSIGIAFSATGEEDGETLLQNADLALYRAKQEGRSRFEIFGEALRDHVETRRETEKALRLGIPRNELRVYFQPIIATDDGTITSFEALARWRRPGYGLISPAEFIPIAEEAGLIAELGAWVLSHACQQAASWAARWPDRQIGVAVNLSAHQLVRGDVVELVRHALTTSALDPQLLTLELTESTIIDNPQDAEQLLLTLRDLGVNLAIDDFGTGYSSLTYLRRLPINAIKIDQSFIRAIGTEKEDTAIVAAVINLARNLNLRVVAEGVETAQQLATLVHLNCAHLQGYFFSEPKPADELPELIERIPAWTFAPARG